MTKSPKRHATLKQIIDVGLVQRPLQIRGRPQGNEFFGEVATANGATTWQGNACDSLLAAVSDALASISGYLRGEYPSANGWLPANGWAFWEHQDANREWEPLRTLREHYNKCT